MPKQIIQDVAQQLGQLGEETLDSFKNAPGDMAGRAMEQLGVSSSKNPAGSQNPAAGGAGDQLAQVKKLEEMDRQQSEQGITQLRSQLEQEIEKWRKIREEQLRQRREMEAAAAEQAAAQATEAGGGIPKQTQKRSRGLFGGGGRRVKSAQELSQPETAGKRVGG